MFLHERIQQKLDERNLKQADIARATGKSTAAVNKWLKGDNVPKAENLKAIAKLLDVSDEWLLTGKDGKVSKESNGHVTNTEILIYEDGDPVPDGFSAIDFYDDVFVSAGNGYLNIEQPSARKFFIPTYLLQANDVRTSYAKVVMVRGDSMFPVLMDGCPISIDMSARRIIDGEIYAFQVGDETKIKYLYSWNDEGKGGFIARSANPDKNRYPDEYYSPSKIEVEGITIIGQYWAKLETKKIRR
ncbi:XRE family transcriptional regulator [Acinetobacter baumannii]|uniref:XRE family transcriptional regulator n=1 Tax=Acinetobacter baumannii TaxID=470 RepID=UPI003AF8CEDC